MEVLGFLYSAVLNLFSYGILALIIYLIVKGVKSHKKSKEEEAARRKAAWIAEREALAKSIERDDEDFLIKGFSLIEYRGHSDSVVVPSGVERIGSYDEYNDMDRPICKKTLYAIYIPKTVQTINDCALLHVKRVCYEGSEEEWNQSVFFNSDYNFLVGWVPDNERFTVSKVDFIFNNPHHLYEEEYKKIRSRASSNSNPTASTGVSTITTSTTTPNKTTSTATSTVTPTTTNSIAMSRLHDYIALCTKISEIGGCKPKLICLSKDEYSSRICISANAHIPHIPTFHKAIQFDNTEPGSSEKFYYSFLEPNKNYWKSLTAFHSLNSFLRLVSGDTIDGVKISASWGCDYISYELGEFDTEDDAAKVFGELYSEVEQYSKTHGYRFYGNPSGFFKFESY